MPFNHRIPWEFFDDDPYGFGVRAAPTPPGAWVPTDAASANCVEWHQSGVGLYSDAGTTPAVDGGTVRQWNDQSGNANHATQATAGRRPIYNSDDGTVEQPGADVNSPCRTLELPASVDAQSYSVFYIGYVRSLRPSRMAGYFHTFFQDTSGGNKLGFFDDVHSPGGASDPTTMRRLTDGTSTATKYVPSSACLFGVTSSAIEKQFVTGSAIETGAPEGAGGAIAFRAFGSASGTTATEFPLVGGCKEIIVYDGPLDSTDLANLQDYARRICNQGSATTQLVISGTSILSGYETTKNEDCIRLLCRAMPNLAVYNVALAGSAWGQWQGAGAGGNEGMILVDGTYSKRYLLHDIGTNDIVSSVSAASCLSSAATYYGDRKAAATVTVIGSTMLDRTDFTAPQRTERNTYNTTFRTSVGVRWDLLADWGDDAAITFGDGVHPDDTGHARMFQYLFDLFNPTSLLPYEPSRRSFDFLNHRNIGIRQPVYRSPGSR